MGKQNPKKTIVAIICFLAVSAVIYSKPPDRVIPKKALDLKSILANLGQWKAIADIPLERNIFEDLKLDDYVFRTYENKLKKITLYIGYYFSAKKIGAAHDPLVCFPGQGWVLSNNSHGTFNLRNSKFVIRYSKMIAERNGEKEFILYWFQSNNTALPDTFQQKLALLKGQFLNEKGENAFVRITIPMKDRTESETIHIAKSFTESMFPHLIKYINS